MSPFVWKSSTKARMSFHRQRNHIAEQSVLQRRNLKKMKKIKPAAWVLLMDLNHDASMHRMRMRTWWQSKGMSLLEMIKDKGGVWDEIVREKGLVPTKLEEVGVWWVAAFALNTEPTLDSMNKSKEHGSRSFYHCFSCLGLAHGSQPRDSESRSRGYLDPAACGVVLAGKPFRPKLGSSVG